MLRRVKSIERDLECSIITSFVIDFGSDVRCDVASSMSHHHASHIIARHAAVHALHAIVMIVKEKTKKNEEIFNANSGAHTW